MSIYSIHLRKLLRLFFAPENLQISILRSDIRSEIAKAEGYETGGGDFYVPFWKDAKDHTIGVGDLTRAVSARIDSNERRENLYPRLRDGFLLWWNERRRWTNEPFHPVPSPKGIVNFPKLDATVRIENFLSLRGTQEDMHFVYPYFSPNPELQEDAARLGLWAICEANLIADHGSIRILDVIRGRSFSIEQLGLEGGERGDFSARYRRLISTWEGLWDDYE